jgi:S-adenosylmethionine decarboxylase
MKKTKRSELWTQTKNKNSLGRHLVADFWFGKTIEDPKEIKRVLIEAAKRGKNVPLEFSFHKFNPHGITGILLLAESHISLHSWPEFGFVAIDIFSCGKKKFPERALKYLKSVFKPKKIEVTKIVRGKLK